jgi:hypothetical protein
LRRQVDAVALRDARLDLADDLIDVGLVGLRFLAAATPLGCRRRTAVSTAVVPAPAAMEVLAAALIRMLICCHFDR